MASQKDPIYISYRPDYVFRQPLKDNWSFAPDYLRCSQPGALPLKTPVIGALRTVATIDADQAGPHDVVHTVTSNNHQHSLIFNGRPLLCNGNFDVNVTPWVKFGQNNEIIVISDTTIIAAEKDAHIHLCVRCVLC